MSKFKWFNLKFPQFFLLSVQQKKSTDKALKQFFSVFSPLSCFMLVLIINGVCYKWLCEPHSLPFSMLILNFSVPLSTCEHLYIQQKKMYKKYQEMILFTIHVMVGGGNGWSRKEKFFTWFTMQSSKAT